MTENELVEMDLLEIPAEPTDRNFTMDPRTEDLIRGSELKEGMIVLFEDSLGKDSLALVPEEDIALEYYNQRITINQHWCKVTKLQGGQIISFIGVYADGVKHSRTYNKNWVWIVKKDSM